MFYVRLKNTDVKLGTLEGCRMYARISQYLLLDLEKRICTVCNIFDVKFRPSDFFDNEKLVTRLRCTQTS